MKAKQDAVKHPRRTKLWNATNKIEITIFFFIFSSLSSRTVVFFFFSTHQLILRYKFRAKRKNLCNKIQYIKIFRWKAKLKRRCNSIKLEKKKTSKEVAATNTSTQDERKWEKKRWRRGAKRKLHVWKQDKNEFLFDVVLLLVYTVCDATVDRAKDTWCLRFIPNANGCICALRSISSHLPTVLYAFLYLHCFSSGFALFCR